MNSIHHNGRNCDIGKTYSGCLGRMVSLFELNVGVPTNRLLNDKPHQDGSTLSRSSSGVSRISPYGDSIEERVIVPELKNRFSNRKPNGTPMKMLIAQEMSKEVDSRRDPPNLVAKLMGLDALPQQEPDSAIIRSHSRDQPHSDSDISMSYWEQDNGFVRYTDPNECQDVRRIWQQSQELPHVARYEKSTIEEKMALVRQKFIEAKFLSMNEKPHQSKQFQDALEVLSSNRDLFLKYLQEPYSMFTENLYNQESAPHPPATKRITVLRPSKMTSINDFAGPGNEDGKQMIYGAFLQMSDLQKVHPVSSPPASIKHRGNSTHPTQIVVLKPSPGKTYDVKAVGSLYSELPRMLHKEDFSGDKYGENQELREAAKAITQQMRERLGRQLIDETLISSVLSIGYAGDESSFHKSELEKSELEYADGSLSDSEAASLVSTHSWDYVNRLSPYSSSFTRASYSSESSVCREAKKRLSERWATMTSNGICQEQRHIHRSSATLGEMLALSETKISSHSGEGSSSQESKGSSILFVGEQRREENMDNSPRILMRSKSLPVSATEFGSRLNVGISRSDMGKSESLKDTKARSAKLSLKGKVASLFFSRNKQSDKDKFLVSDTKDEPYLSPGGICRDRIEIFNGKQDMISPETGLYVEKPIGFGYPGENQDHQSPVSVLNPSFEEDKHIEKVFSHYSKPDRKGVESSLNSIGSHLIGKSPPIGSIARSLSWDYSCGNTDSSHPPYKLLTTQRADEEEQWFFYVKALLSVAGLQGEVQSNNSFLARWHSPESPLDPLLRDRYIDLEDKKTLHDGNQSQNSQKLVFDYVNATLVEIAGYKSHLGQRAIPCIGAHDFVSKNSSSTVLDEVWTRMKIWLSGEVRGVSDDCWYNDSLVVKKEVVGKGWSDGFGLEMDNLGKAIQGRLLEELVLEVALELKLTVSM